MAEVRKHLRLHAPEANRVKVPTLTDRFSHTRNTARSTEKFFTTGRYVPEGCSRDVLTEPNPFSRAEASDILQKVFMHTENKNPPPETCFIHKYCMSPCTCKYLNENHSTDTEEKKCVRPFKKSIIAKDSERDESVSRTLSSKRTLKSPIQVNPISARLHVPEVPLPPSKTDIDPEFFNIARGRPVKETFNRHDFSRIQKTVTFKKLFSGFLQDSVKKRVEHHRLDAWQLENINRELDRAKMTQEAFANESHAESVKIVTEQMAISKIRDAREEELKRCKGFVNSIKSSLYKKDDILSMSMYCRDILLQLSPTKFRLDYEEEVKKHRSQTKKIANKVLSLFTDYCRYNPDSEPDLFLNEVVSTFVKQLLSLGPPKIHFKSKWELDVVFRALEIHCMEQMADLEKMQRLQDEIDAIARDVKKFYSTQIYFVKQEIDAFNAHSEYQTKRSFELENDTNIAVSTVFKEVVSGDVVIEILSLVEVLYNYILGPSNAKFDAPEMMVQIEQELQNVEVQIQTIGKKAYRIFEKKVTSKMDRSMKEAVKAKKNNREVRAAILRVKNMLTKPPGCNPGWRRPVWRSSPIERKKVIADAKTEAKEDKKMVKHLQLDGICDRDDIEVEIDELLNKFAMVGVERYLGMQTSKSDEALEESEPAITDHSSLRSSVSSASMIEAIQPLYGGPEDDAGSQKSLSIIQLDYDSEEELLRKNFERRRRRGEDIDEPEVLYDIRSIDSKFMVSNTVQQMALKDRRKTHRPEHRPKNNPLSWSFERFLRHHNPRLRGTPQPTVT